MAPSTNGVASGTASGASTGSPCGACKFLRRKCAADCIFAPYFCSEQGPARFAAIHKVFGASNVSKLLHQVPVPNRCEAVVTIAYEAEARVRDPVYGCVAHVFALQQQVAYLQAQLMQAKARVVEDLLMDVTNYSQNQEWMSGSNCVYGSLNQSSRLPNYHPTSYMDSFENVSTKSSTESGDQSIDSLSMQEIESQNHQHHQQGQKFCNSFMQQLSKKRPPSCDLGELQALAIRMMRN